MGAGAAKQTKVKKIYVKGKETIDTNGNEDPIPDYIVSKRSIGSGNPSRPRPIPVDSMMESEAANLPQQTGEGAPKPATHLTQVEVEMDNKKIYAALHNAAPAPALLPAHAGEMIKDSKEAKVESPRTLARKYSLSPRSISSDEGPGVTSQPEVVIPKVAYAQALREGYERRAQERAAWLRAYDETPADPASAPDMRPNVKPTFGFNDTRKQLPALRDPDTNIFEELQKWNVKMHKDEAPIAQPVHF